MGMLRTMIILGAGFALMPSPPPSAQTEPPLAPDNAAYLSAAFEAMADMRSFCQRNPNLCSTAGAFARTAEGKAKYSAKLIYEWANDAKNSGKANDVDPIQTSALEMALPSDEVDQDTLTDADRAPKWRKPKG